MKFFACLSLFSLLFFPLATVFSEENLLCEEQKELLREAHKTCFFGEIFHRQINECRFFCEGKSSCPLLFSLFERKVALLGEPKVFSPRIFNGFTSDNFLPLITYSVRDEMLSSPTVHNTPLIFSIFQKDTAEHEIYWNFFRHLVPERFREHVVEFRFSSDGAGGQTGFVDSTRNGVRFTIDPADADDIVYNVFHELAHLVATSSEERAKEVLSEVCGADTASLLQMFTKQFWDSYGNDFYEISKAKDEEERLQLMSSLGEHYPNAFITEYATTSPVEDFAESFAHFLLFPRPEGSDLSDKKIQFFWNSSEMVRLRLSIQWKLFLLEKRKEIPKVYS